MKRGVMLFAIVLCVLSVTAQVQDPVSWKFEAKKKTADTYEVILTATLEGPWHIYSQNTGKGGPIPTKVVFKANPLIGLSGKTLEKGKLEKIYDTNFKTDVLFYGKTVAFVQEIKVKGGVKTNIAGNVEYMVCNDEQCLPPTRKVFDIKL